MVNDVFNLLKKYSDSPSSGAIGGMVGSLNKGVDVKKEQIAKKKE